MKTSKKIAIKTAMAVGNISFGLALITLLGAAGSSDLGKPYGTALAAGLALMGLALTGHLIARAIVGRSLDFDHKDMI